MKPSNDLTRLSDLEGALGDAFRSARSDTPSPGAKAALLATLGAGAAIATTTAASASAAAGAASGAGAGAVAKTSAGFFAAKWIVVSAALAVGGATTYAVHEAIQAPVAVTASTSEPRPTAMIAPRATVSVAPVATPSTKSESQSESEPVPVAPAPITLGTSAPPAIVATTVRPTAQASPPAPAAPPAAPRTAAPIPTPEPVLDAPAPPAKPASAVGDEITMLDEARREMNAGRSANALAVLGRYSTRFPHGVMSEEARVLEIEALARSGQSARARELGASFIASHPSSPLVSRVRRAVDLP